MKFKYIVIACLFPIFCQGQVVKGFDQINNQVNVALPGGTISRVLWLEMP